MQVLLKCQTHSRSLIFAGKNLRHNFCNRRNQTSEPFNILRETRDQISLIDGLTGRSCNERRASKNHTFIPFWRIGWFFTTYPSLINVIPIWVCNFDCDRGKFIIPITSVLKRCNLISHFCSFRLHELTSAVRVKTIGKPMVLTDHNKCCYGESNPRFQT